MGNMSYCRFENTLGDLDDCKEELDNLGLKGVLEDVNSREKPKVVELIEMCREIAENYYEELEKMQNDGDI